MPETVILMGEERMEKTVESLKKDLGLIRTGRANPAILNNVCVDYYGVPTPINQMANISVPEARMILVNVWDQTQLREVSKAIQAADLGVTPSDDGKVIRLVFPALTEERRKEIVKQVKKLCEETKIVLRNARRDCLDMYKQMKKDNELSEDEYATLEDEVQKIQDKYVALCDKECEAKESEVMEI